jgi:hypothetical protein
MQKERCFVHLLYSDRWYNPTFYCEKLLDFRDSGAFPSAHINRMTVFLEGDDDDALMGGGTFDFDIEEEGDVDSGVAVPLVAAAFGNSYGFG